MALIGQRVPLAMMARAQGLLAAANGLVMSMTAIVSGALYPVMGDGLYLVTAAMALAGVAVIVLGRGSVARA